MTTCSVRVLGQSLKIARGRGNEIVTPLRSRGLNAAPKESVWSSLSTTESVDRGCHAGRRGNVSWYFGNFGTLTTKHGVNHKSELSEQIRAALKRTPAQIVGLAECDAALEECLKQSGPSTRDDTLNADDNDAAVAAVAKRTEAEFLTLRGNEQSSVLFGSLR